MAFQRQNFSRSTGSFSGSSLSTYNSSDDNKAAIQAADYFIDGGADRSLLNTLKPKDWILAEGTDGATILTVLAVDLVTPSLTVTALV